MLTSGNEQTENSHISSSPHAVEYDFNHSTQSFLNSFKLPSWNRLTFAGIFWISYALFWGSLGAGICFL